MQRVKLDIEARRQWLTSVIPATRVAEIRRIVIRSQQGHIALETLSRKTPSQKMAGGVAPGVGRVQAPVPQKKKKRNKRHRDYFCL
jgi:hypothetical protein